MKTRIALVSLLAVALMALLVGTLRAGEEKETTLAGTLDFYLKAMSADGRVSDAVVQDLINEQRELLGVKTEVPLSQVADFGPLNRVVKELSPGR